MGKVHFSDDHGKTVCGVLDIPEGAKSVVIMSHGFTSHKDSNIYCELQGMLAKQSIGSLRYDYFGHGESDGEFEDITVDSTFASIDAAIKYVMDSGDYEVGLLGASFGGLLSILGAGANLRVKAVALKSPVTDIVALWKGRLSEAEIAKWKEDGVLHYDDLGEKFDIKYSFWESLQGYDIPEMAKIGLTCPTLIVHGDADTVVPVGPSIEFATAIGAQMHVIKGADHAYSTPVHYEECKRAMVDFLVEQLKQQS